ncbi:hypothetical protein H4219_006246 [Mycoemilia scoparia]|uniref:RRM domain-containing protein n=1 Tax=Mycoemilia scoparia TaxID=417184 RepID=A0A9W8DMJ0_9FUNG|nr:hypothetical protein H4219_006246 [Mycoemilia scoparia]
MSKSDSKKEKRKSKSHTNKNNDSDTKSSKSKQPLKELAGYKVLPIHFEDNEDAVHYLYLRRHSDQKFHPMTPSDRTLFVLNLPVFATEKSIRQLFKKYGRVSDVWFQDKLGYDIFHKQAEEQKAMAEIQKRQQQEQEALENMISKGKKNKKSKSKKSKDNEQNNKNDGDNEEEMEDQNKFEPVKLRHLNKMGSYAHVVFLEKKELDKVLEMVEPKKKLMWPSTVSSAAGEQKDGENDDDDDDSMDEDNDNSIAEPTEYMGINRYIYEYRAARPPADMLKKEVDQFMTKFMEAEYERERQMAATRNVPDEDGFITVTSRRSRRGAAASGAPDSDGFITVGVARKEEAEAIAARQKKKKELTNFYRWQQREQKRDRLVELRKKFEEDKQKIAQLKSTRRFRPY